MRVPSFWSILSDVSGKGFAIASVSSDPLDADSWGLKPSLVGGIEGTFATGLCPMESEESEFNGEADDCRLESGATGTTCVGSVLLTRTRSSIHR
jgi:hypothetical protein